MTEKYALVTGGATGLGASFVRHLSSDGYNVIIHYNKHAGSAEKLRDEVIDAFGIECITISADFTQEGCGGYSRAKLAGLIGHYTSKLDVIIHNAGWYADMTRLQLRNQVLEDWHKALSINLTAVFDLTQMLLPMMPRKEWKRQHTLEKEGMWYQDVISNEGPYGRIIMIGDCIADRLIAFKNATPYHISKIGLHVLMKSYAADLAGSGITVNMISPGFLENSTGTPPRKLPSGEALGFENVIAAARYLLSPGAAHVTGTNLIVADGWRL